jgi:hypothetical protein
LHVHPGETRIDLPLGGFISKSPKFEIKPVRRVIEVTPDTQELTIEIEKVLPWREQGWVSAGHARTLSYTYVGL